MRQLCILLLAMLLSSGTITTKAQVDSSALLEKSMLIRQYVLTGFGFDTTWYQKPDTALHRVWQYDPATGTSAWANLGVVGSAARPLLIQLGNFRPFSSGFDAFVLYDYQADSGRFWSVNKPLTSFDFSSGGGNNQQAFKLFHTQNIGKTVNIGAEYRLLSSDGWYANEATNNKNFRFFGSMVSPNRRYAMHLQYLTNNHTNEQNGGIVPGRLFEQGLFVAPLGVPVNLSNARMRTNNRTLWLHHQYRMAGSDSSFAGWGFFHQISYRREFFAFSDPSSGSAYYPNQRISPVIAPDSNGFRQLENSVGAKSMSPFSNVQWQFALNHTLGNVRNNENFTKQQVFWSAAHMSYRLGKWELQGKLAQVFFDALQERTHQAEIKLNYELQKRVNITFGMIDQRQNAGFAAQQFQGLFQQWNQPLKAIEERSVFASLQLPFGQLEAKRGELQNWVYWDAKGIVQQDPMSQSFYQINARSSLKWWKFRLDLNHGYQLFENGGSIRAPRFFSQDILSFSHRFKAGWELQLGTDFRYHTAYLAPGFRPEVGQFVLQDSLQAGNYPLFDLFAAIKVKRTRLFVKFEHANQGFPAPNFYTVPLYPMYSRAFRFGLTWAFYE